MVGRSGELATLERSLAAAGEGQAGASLVAGEAGVGKTRLVAELAAHARTTGALVLAGGCLELGKGVLPYGPLIEALRSMAGAVDRAALFEVLGPAREELARLLPDVFSPQSGDREAQDDGPGTSQGYLFELLLGLVARLSTNQTLLVIFEDLHWADRSTRDLIRFLVHRLDVAGRVLFVGTYRSDEVHRRHPLLPLLAELERGGRVERLDLPRLGRGDTERLLAQILTGPVEAELVAAIHGRSEGNPFFVEELVASGATSMPDTLREVLVARMGALGARTQDLLGVVAAAGRPVDHRLLASVAGMSEGALLAALREAVDRQVLVAEPDHNRYRFRHALLAEVAYAELLPGERARIHRAYARALRASPGLRDPAPASAAAELAHHEDLAGDREAALPALVAAGVAAERVYAFGEALRHYERALALWDHVDDAPARTDRDVAWLFARAAEAALFGGEAPRAVALGQAAFDHIDPLTEPERAGLAASRLALFHSVNGDRDRAIEMATQGLRLIPADPPTAARAQVAASLGGQLAVVGRFREAIPLCNEALEVARAAGARAEEGRALMVLGVALSRSGDFPAGIPHLRRSHEIASSVGDRETEDRTAVNLAPPLHFAGRLEEALEIGRRGIDIAKRGGSIAWATIQCNAANCALKLGRWDEAERLLQDVVALPAFGMYGICSRLTMADLGASRGRHQETVAWLATARKLYASSRAPGGEGPHEMTARLELWRRRPEEASRTILEGLAALPDPTSDVAVRELCWLGLRALADRAELARARRDTGLVTVVQNQADELIALLGRHSAHIREVTLTPDAHLAADEAQATAEYGRAMGSSDPAQWATAAETWEELTHPFDAAYARWREGEATLASKGTSGRAQKALRDAYSTAERLGAEPLKRELESLARRARIDLLARPVVASVKAASSVPDASGLTPREREVLAWLVSGATDRQIAAALFVTEKTANSHVANIKGKLNAANRVEAVSIALRLGLVDELEQ
jgi:DNA-binding CsgD family transcriptional regulator/tetratricopeptide (TPR) repeat protein